MLLTKIKMLPIGYSEVRYLDKKYGVTRREFNKGASHKIYAEELGGRDFVSMNYYKIGNSEHLKPCEMTVQKVIDFLTGCRLIK